LCTGDEEDNYYFDATSGTLQINVTIPPSLVGKSSMWVYRASSLGVGSEIPACSQSTISTQTLSKTCALSTAERYVVRLYASPNVADNVNPYTLKVTYP
jgi:hypothetical protein